MKSLMIAVVSLALATPVVAHAGVKVGDKFVELDAKTAKGKNFHLKDMTGKWVVFTFGASWCQPCHKELPAWDKIAPKFAGKALFVAININDKQQEGLDFFNSLGLKHMFPVFMPQETSEALKSYDPEHMPSTFVIDPQGVIQEIHLGYDKGDEDALSKKLSDLIK